MICYAKKRQIESENFPGIFLGKNDDFGIPLTNWVSIKPKKGITLDKCDSEN